MDEDELGGWEMDEHELHGRDGMGDGWTDGQRRMDGWMDGWMDRGGWMDGWMEADGWVDSQINRLEYESLQPSRWMDPCAAFHEPGHCRFFGVMLPASAHKYCLGF